MEIDEDGHLNGFGEKCFNCVASLDTTPESAHTKARAKERAKARNVR